MPGFISSTRKRVRPELLPEPQKPLKSALKRPAPQPAPSVPRRKDAPARRDSFDDDDDNSDEPQFVGTIAGTQKKVKSELRPDYLLRAEELKQKRLHELQHSFEDDRGFVLTPLGVPQNLQKAVRTTTTMATTTTQKKSKSARRLSSSSADDDVSKANQGVTIVGAAGDDDDDDYVPAFDDDDFATPVSPARRQRSSTDSTSNEDSDADESSRRSKASQSRSPPKKSTAMRRECDWSFLSISKRTASSSATVTPLSLPPRPLSLPPEPLRLPPAKPAAAPTITQMMVPMVMPPPTHVPAASQQPLLPMEMQMQMQMPGAPMMWPHAMYNMGLQMGMQMAQRMSMQQSPMSFPTHGVAGATPTITTTATAAASATASMYSSFPFQPAELSSSFPSPIASSPMPDPRVEELEDAPF